MGSIWALRNWRCDRALLQNLNRRAYNLGFHPVIFRPDSIRGLDTEWKRLSALKLLLWSLSA